MPTTIKQIQDFTIKVDRALEGQRGLDTKLADPVLLEEGVTLIANAEPKITFDVIDKKTAKAIPEGTLAYLARIRFLLNKHATEHLKQSNVSDTPVDTAAVMPSVAVEEEQPTDAARIQSVESANPEADLAEIEALISAFEKLPSARNPNYTKARNDLIAANRVFLERYAIFDTDPKEIIKQLNIVKTPAPQVFERVAPPPPPPPLSPRVSVDSGTGSEAQVTPTPIIKIDDLIPQINAFIADVENLSSAVNRGRWLLSLANFTTDPTEALKDRGKQLLAQIGYRAETDVDVKEMARILGVIKADIEEEGVHDQYAQQTPVEEQLTGEQLATGGSSQAEDEDEQEEEELDDEAQSQVEDEGAQAPQAPTPARRRERATAPAQPGSTQSRFNVLPNLSGYFRKKPLYPVNFFQSRSAPAQDTLRRQVKKPTPPKTPAPKSQVLTDALTTNFQSKMQTFAKKIPKVKQLLGELEKIKDLPAYMQKVIQISSVINSSTSLTDLEKNAANDLVALHNAALLQSQIHRLESINTSLQQVLANPNPTGQDYSNLATLTHQVHYELDELRRVLTVGLSSYPEFVNVNKKINQIMKASPSRRRALLGELRSLFTVQIRQQLQSKSNDLSVTGVDAIVRATYNIVQAEGQIALHRKPQESAQAQNTTGSRVPNLRGMASSAVQFGSGLTASAAPYVSGAVTNIRTRAEQAATRAQRLVVTDRSTLEEKVYNIIIQALEAYAKLESTSAANKQALSQYIANQFSGAHALPRDLAEQIRILKGIENNPELTSKAYAAVINAHLDDLQKRIKTAADAIGTEEFEAYYVYANNTKDAIDAAIRDPEVALENSPTHNRLKSMATQFPKIKERDRIARERVGTADMAVVNAGSDLAAMKFRQIERDLTRVKFDSNKENFDDYMQAVGRIDHAITEIAAALSDLYEVIRVHNLTEAQLSNANQIAAIMTEDVKQATEASIALPQIRTNITKALEELNKDKAIPSKLKSALANALNAKLAVIDLNMQVLNYEEKNPGIKKQAADNAALYKATKELENATTAANAIKKISGQNMNDAERALAEIEESRDMVWGQILLATGISIPDADDQPFNQDILEATTNRIADIPYGLRINQTSVYRDLLNNNQIANSAYNPFVKHLLTTLAKAQVAAFDLEYRILLVNPSIQYINFLASQFTATPQPTKEELVKVRYALDQALKNYAKIHGHEVQDPETAQAIKHAQDELQKFIAAEASATAGRSWFSRTGMKMGGFRGFGRGKEAGAEEDDAISITGSDEGLDKGLDEELGSLGSDADVTAQVDTSDEPPHPGAQRLPGMGHVPDIAAARAGGMTIGAAVENAEEEDSDDATIADEAATAEEEEDFDDASTTADEAEDATAGSHKQAKPTATGTISKAADLRTAFREVCKDKVNNDPERKYNFTQGRKGYVFGRTPPLTLKHDTQEKITLNAPRKINGKSVTVAALYKGETDSWTVLLESMKRSKNKHCTFSLGTEGNIDKKAAQFLVALMEVEKPLNKSELSFSFYPDDKDPLTKQAIFDALKDENHKEAREFFGMEKDLDANGRLQKLADLDTATSKNVNLFYLELKAEARAPHHGGPPV